MTFKKDKKQSNKEYYQKNRETIIEKVKLWQKENKEKANKKSRKFYWKNRNKEIEKLKTKRQNKKYKENQKIKQKEYAQNNPKKIEAHKLASKIPLNPFCEICNSRKNLERHHWDYNQPLLIVTLCRECHKIQHIKNFGEF